MTVTVHAFPEGETAARMLAAALGCAFGQVELHGFPDGEVLPRIPEVADTVIVYRSLDRPNEKLIELVLAAEAWRRLGARRLVLVAPYLAYMRQDAAFLGGQAISQRAVADLLSRYFDRVVTVNAHLHRTHSLADVFPSIEARDLSIGPELGKWLHQRGPPEAIVVGPDQEAGPLAHSVARAAGSRCLVLSKTRRGDSVVELAAEAPERFAGLPVVLVDDICSSGATLAAAAARVRGMGAAQVDVLVVHALFDAHAEARLKAAGVGSILSTDSVPHRTNGLSLTTLLAEALRSEIVPNAGPD